MRQQNGFTLIEILVSLAILAVVSGIGLVTYNNSTKISRDARRKDDLRRMQTAFEVFYQKHKYYPAYLQGNGDQHDSSSSCHFTLWKNMFQYGFDSSGNQITLSDPTSDYISEVPVDPVNDCHYHYNYRPIPDSGANAGQDYILCYSLENTNDPAYNPGFWGSYTVPCAGHTAGVFSPFHT